MVMMSVSYAAAAAAAAADDDGTSGDTANYSI